MMPPDRRFRIPVIESLPAASSERQGQVWRVRGTPDAVWFCGKNSGGTYTWIDLSDDSAAVTAALAAHEADTANPHAVTSAQVGLGNVDNTADLNKPISTATQTALDGKSDTGHTHAASDTSYIASLSANQSVSALAAVTGLRVPVGASETWRIEWNLFLESDSANGCQFSVYEETLEVAWDGFATVVGYGSSTTVIRSDRIPVDGTYTGNSYAAGAATDEWARIVATLTTDAAAGHVDLYINPGASATIIAKKHSSVIAEQIV